MFSQRCKRYTFRQGASIETSLLDSVEQINKDRANDLLKIKNIFPEEISPSGDLVFKPNTDDIREAPSIFIVKDLLKMGIN